MSEPAANAPARAPLTAWPFIALIKLYQFTLSPLLGRQCRFHPTCSWYGLEAYRRFGAAKGTRLTMRRLARCHPFSKGGYDPVPVNPHLSKRRDTGVSDR